MFLSIINGVGRLNALLFQILVLNFKLCIILPYDSNIINLCIIKCFQQFSFSFYKKSTVDLG